MFASTTTDFNQSGRLGNDYIDVSQKNQQNTAYLNNILNNYSVNELSNTHIQFATQYPGIMVGNTNLGTGIGSSLVESESNLLLNKEHQRPLEKLQLHPRTFSTIPYLGRGSCDPMVESQLQQGENVRGKKSASTVMEKNFMPLDSYPLDEQKKKFVNSSSIEELALNGWVRGGKATRELEENYFSKNSKPRDKGY